MSDSGFFEWLKLCASNNINFAIEMTQTTRTLLLKLLKRLKWLKNSPTPNMSLFLTLVLQICRKCPILKHICWGTSLQVGVILWPRALSMNWTLVLPLGSENETLGSYNTLSKYQRSWNQSLLGRVIAHSWNTSHSGKWRRAWQST